MAVVSFWLFLLVIILIHSQGSAQICDNEKGNYTANSTYASNLNTLLSSLSTHTEIDYGFYNFSYGQDPDRAYAIGQCAGFTSIKPDDCRRCLNESKVNLKLLCPNQKEAFGWIWPNCSLRYSNRSILGGKLDTEPTSRSDRVMNAKDVDKFNQALSDLLNSLRSIAASGDSRRKYAAAHSSPAFPLLTIFGYVQCTPDLSKQDCNTCLVAAIQEIQVYVNGQIGSNIVKPSCIVRYEFYPFYGSTDSILPQAPPSPPPPPYTNSTSFQGRGKHKIITITVIVVPSVVSVVLLSLGCYCFQRGKERKTHDDILQESFGTNDITALESLRFGLAKIEAATNRFAKENLIGKGGFGEVYKGILPDGQQIAVKRLTGISRRGADEFKNEVLVIAKLQHKNLVKLLGFCLEGKEKILIFEYVPNKSLDYFLFDPNKCKLLSWLIRYKIITGIARGILYLHEDSRLKIIHRDLKPGNILLDENMNPKISDFGMARIVATNETESSTHKIVGT